MNALKVQIFFSIVLYSFAVGIFIFGFIPKKPFNVNSPNDYDWEYNCLEILKNKSTCIDLSKKSYTRKFDKLVLIVIDALRADFIPSIIKSEFNVSLPFTESLLHKKSAISFINKVFSPTVTLPRIKTLVTGRTSSFIDLINNFNAKELNEDSFLNQASLNGMKSVFYGDETWLKVFPNLFLRSDGTHSFYVRDFKEVDDNVTRHLKTELSMKDWDIMVLHYLGVDHIGHGYGPYSSYLAPKLKEMDSLINFIYSQLKENSNNKSSLIVICGDHGMTSEGNHGGITKSETLTPLIFISTSNSKYYSSTNNKIVSQVDIAITLSVLLGLPLPKSNTGTVILDVLRYSGVCPRQILNVLFYNVLQLYQLQKRAFNANKHLFQNIKEVFELHWKELKLTDNENDEPNYIVILEKYTLLLRKLAESLNHDFNFDNLSLIFGLAIMWVCVMWLVVCLLIRKSPKLIFEVLYFCFNPTAAKLYISAIIASIILYFNLLDYVFLIIAYTVFSLSIFTLCLVIWVSTYMYKKLSFTILEKLCLLFFTLHSLSLFSSSYVEKEHHTWYFIITSTLVLLTTRIGFNDLNQYATIKNYKQSGIIDLLKTFISQRQMSKFDASVLFLLSFYMFRDYGVNDNRINVSRFFRLEENYLSCLALFLNQMVIMYIFFKKQNNKRAFYTFCSGLILIYFYKTQNKNLTIFLETFSLNIIIIPWAVYMHILIILFFSILHLIMHNSLSVFEKNIVLILDITASWILLTQLIGQIHLILFTTVVLLQEILLYKIIWEESYGMLIKICLYLQLSIYSFFCQGNSNSLSTIDISSGYVGLSSYKPILVGILIICNTYRSLILWLFLLFFRILYFFNKNKTMSISTKWHEILFYFLSIVVYRFFILAMYCIVMFLMKHHLFIMSVFAPKLFYEIANVGVYILCFSFLAMSQYFCRILK